jgi:ABC-type multidrug transport system fused ATPase/permease subunit
MKTPPKPRYQHKVREILSEYGKHLKGIRWLFVPVVAGMFIDASLQSGVVAYLRMVIDQLVADPAVFMREHLRTYALIGVAGGLVFLPCAFAGHFCSALLASRLVVRFRTTLYSHLQKLSLGFFHQTQVGEVSTRLIGDIDTGVHGLVGYVISVSWALTMVLVSLGSMLFLSWRLTLIFLAITFVYTILSRTFLPRIRAISREVRDQSGEFNAQLTEDVSAIALVKAFARERWFFERFRASQDRLYGSQVRAAALGALYTDVIQTVALFLAPVAILGVGAMMVGDGLSVGTLVAFWTYWTVIRAPVNTLFNSMSTLFNGFAAMDRVLEFLEQQPMPHDPPRAPSLIVKGGLIEFRQVTFGYPAAAERTVLHDIALTVPAHSTLGIVGPSGAGKSTLIQLLLRFYDPGRGAILIDGQDLKQVTQDSLRSQVGVVLQDTILLSGSIRENLLLGREKAREAELWSALERAGAAVFVRDLPGELDAELGERGVNLSGGQRQRLAIARTFLKDPPIVVFDEATSSLDSATEAMIQESMSRLFQGRTALIIAHRLSTVVHCDRILLLDRGRVAGLAPHAELLRTNPLYENLVFGQTGLAGKAH